MTVDPTSAITKYRPPPPAGNLVVRSRLIDVLRAGQGRRLVLIHAPAGFGKTTLAAQWRDELTAQGVAVAWLAMDRDDNNAVWFLAHLIESIRRVQPNLVGELGEILEENADQAERYVLAALVNAIDASGRDLVIVVDDWHRVTDGRTLAAMDFLLDIASTHLQLIVTSRTRSGLPLARLRVRDQLVEIDSGALRFDDSESQTLLVDINGLELAEADVAHLRDTTDGWVAALKLVSLSLRGRADPGELVGRLSGRHHSISEYLAENVLDTLDPDILHFLLTTSVTERLCGGLASALSGVERGQAMLELVEANDLFLRPLDEEQEWFRYHHLFADFLRRRLERDHPTWVAGLHLTASQWFAENNLISEAVDHALLAGDVERAVDLVEEHAMHLVEHSQMATLLRLLEKLPAGPVTTRPGLQIAIAWANCLLHRSAAAQDALDHVRAALAVAGVTSADQRERGSDDGAERVREDLLVEASVVQGCIDIYADRIDRAEELVAPCFVRPDSLRPWVVVVAANIATYSDIHQFDFEAALARQRWARRYHGHTAGPFSGVYGHCFAGIAAGEQLDLAAAERHFRAALDLARRSAGRHSHAARLAGALLGDLLYQRGELSEAERLLDESHELGAESGVVDFMLATYTTLARIKALRGNLPAARALLDEGAEAAADLRLERLAAGVNLARVELGLMTLDELAAVAEARVPEREQRGGRAFADGIAVVTRELTEIAAVRAAHLLAPDRAGPAADEGRRVAALVAEMERAGRAKAALQARILLVACLVQAGETERAQDEFLPVLARCAELGLIRPLLDGGPEITALVATLRENQRLGRLSPGAVPREFLSRLLVTDREAREAAGRRTAARDTTGPAKEVHGGTTSGATLAERSADQSPCARVRAEDPLSAREWEILKLLDRGCSNREIARDLGLGVNTVKWYLKSLFVKLGVGRRQECVAEARRRELIT
ncbi:hypothetical protein TH66_05810 [Carbonactinospora thermoautotrophica]|uniref:HTH luxR-type domain-containing protein n=1 Tax=Carbonactinospora thermoautotrophica TaxID=1469144 RepID=A0A132N3J3_9ACTN|nr:LuxR C-terminal-related transcriptional regulator [Carbonactinospora thermoautotrophica]KWX04718.1 hypothetical protein TH66_05810 [Carbonactinospora thermoautotrophica]KWX05204.1 hypothetical protein TR74_23885 [Carbonactinospora thermoautotrophica]